MVYPYIMPISKLLYRTQAKPTVAAFLDSAQHELRPETIDTYRKKLDTFLEWWATHADEDPVTTELTTRYARFLRERLTTRDISKRSFGLYLTPIRQWALFLVKQGVLSENPMAGIRGPGRARGLTHSYLTLPQIKTFLNTFQRDQPVGQRDYVLCYLMLKTAVWAGELARSNVGDLDEIDQKTVLYLYRKGTDDRTDWVVLLPEVTYAIETYLRRRGTCSPKDPLFSTMDGRTERRLTSDEIRRRVVLALQRAGLKRATISGLSLRHSAAMQALRNQAPLDKVQRLLRHRSIKSTQVYQDQLKDVRRGAERYLKY
jgi:site-specific recombinase XerD